MNLAEIRKKAQQEKTNSPVPALKESQSTASAPEESPQFVLEPPPFEAMEVSVAVTAAPDDPLPPGPRTEHPRPERSEDPLREFDPMALILAGRDSTGEDEEGDADAFTSGTARDACEELLCFRVSTETYAINILDIKEIIKPREITEVPRVPAFVSGILSLRGIIIPVFNMRKRLGLPQVPGLAKERIIVIKKGEELCGLLVDEVIQVVKVVAATIEQPPAVLDAVDREFVSGIGRHEQSMLILLNLDNILDINLC